MIHHQRSFSQPLWNGSLQVGGTILLHAEQGMGDALQFIRYAPLVKKRVSQVLVECQPPLLPLLASCPGIDRLIAQGSALPSFDVHAPLMSLPRILGTTVATIPADIPYLFPDPKLIEHWRCVLAPIQAFKIGIAWRARQPRIGRSTPLAHFASLARLEGIRLFSLQKGPGAEELPEFAKRFPMTDFGSEFDQASGAFMDTAAVMKHLDLVVTVDTAVGHCAGALGVPVWVALPFCPDCRWLAGRDDSSVVSYHASVPAEALGGLG